MVHAMSAVVSAGGRVAPLPVERDSILAIQRHLLGQAEPIRARAAGLPDDLATVITDPELRRLTVQLLVILAVVGRRVRGDKVAVVVEAAQRLGVEERGVLLLQRAAQGQFKRIAMSLMKGFVDWWSPSGKAGLRDWMRFVWWMLPQLHGAGTARRNAELAARYAALATLPEGTFGRALHAFYADNSISLPGQPKSVPWVMHEVYHVLSEYGVKLEAELLLTAFVGGSLGENCMDQIMFGLLSYQTGSPLIGGVVAEGLLDPDSYFAAMARGAAMTANVVQGWDLWAVAGADLQELRARYGIPPISEHERAVVGGYNGLLLGPGHSTPADWPGIGQGLAAPVAA
jgi:hypothetical protein